MTFSIKGKDYRIDNPTAAQETRMVNVQQYNTKGHCKVIIQKCIQPITHVVAAFLNQPDNRSAPMSADPTSAWRIVGSL